MDISHFYKLLEEEFNGNEACATEDIVVTVVLPDGNNVNHRIFKDQTAAELLISLHENYIIKGNPKDDWVVVLYTEQDQEIILRDDEIIYDYDSRFFKSIEIKLKCDLFETEHAIKSCVQMKVHALCEST
ncbi:hypothetical protein Bpfe_026241 [Biomphalaria pfeifferi]|uniref:Uncharacterized protein n=1 Tax=Biomphalaria pfeifferi TaxID=112525 RepID=A0AAD8EY65_BIOPF|nr:hypothetical protein Bpfe_026241 [Biomphalaria pfeifferi]